MKKNITVNIGGIIFHIDEDAYDRLEGYLENLKLHFQYMEGRDEVLVDIENRIAEMLQKRITDERQVITLTDVNEVIQAMGQPSEFEDEISGGNAEGKQAQSGSRPKRLFRDPDNKLIGGICSGLGAYFHFDIRMIRLIFVIVTLLGFGIGIIVYLILWIFVPQAITTAEKLEMRGEKVTISNIEKSLREEFDSVKDTVSDLKSKSYQAYQQHKDAGRNIFERIMDVFLRILSTVFKVFVIITGLIFITVGVFLIMGILISFAQTEHIFEVNSFGISTFSAPAFLQLLLDPKDQSLAMVGLCLVVGIPLIMLVYTGARLLFRFKSPSRFVGIPAFSLLIAGLVICGIMTVEALRGFSHKVVSQQTFTLKQPKNNVLYIDIPDNDSIRAINGNNKIMLGNWNMVASGDTNFYFGVPSLEFIKTEADSFQLAVYSVARGESRDLATKTAKQIKYHYLQNDSILQLNPYFYIPEGEKYRSQSVKLVIKVPAGRTIHLSDKMGIFFDNSFHEYAVDMSGKRWRMSDSGLKEIPGRTRPGNDTITVK